MKIRKTSMLCLIIAALFISTFETGCKRYENGPVISFKSRSARVENTWQANLFSRNDLDETHLYEYIHMTFTETQLTWTVKLKDVNEIVMTASWELASLDRQIKLSNITPEITGRDLLYFDISKLKDDELWLEYIMDNDQFQIRLSPQ